MASNLTKKQKEMIENMDQGFGFALLRAVGMNADLMDAWTARMISVCDGYLSAYLWMGIITGDQFSDLRVQDAFRSE